MSYHKLFIFSFKFETRSGYAGIKDSGKCSQAVLCVALNKFRKMSREINEASWRKNRNSTVVVRVW